MIIGQSACTRLLSRTVPYLVAVLAALGAAFVRWELNPLWGTKLPYILFFPTVALAASLGGLGPGLVATGVSAVCALLFLAPLGSMRVDDPHDVIGLALFVVINVLITVLNEALHRARRRGKVARDALRESERLAHETRKFHALLDAAPDAIVSVDEGGRIVFVNTQTEKIFGYRREELLGQAIELLVPERLRDAHVRHREGYCAGPSTRPMGIGLDLRARRKDGSEFPVEISLSPLDAEEGLIVTSIIRDVTERRQADTEMLRLATIVESSEDAIIGKDLNGRVFVWNRAAERLFGWTAEEMRGRSVSVLFPPDRSGELASILDRLRRGERIEHEETTRMRKGGRRIHVSIAVSPIVTSSGLVIGASTIARDITERQRVQEELARQARELVRSNAELEQFAYVTSHDLQEPLRMVASFVQLLERDYGGKLDAQADEYIRFAVDGATRMQEMIRELLEYSRVGRGGRPFSPTDLNWLVGVVIADLQPAIQEAGAVVTSDPLPTVAGDWWELRQLLQNLIANGLKFRGDRPAEVHVGVERAGAEWRFSVRDRGIGIAPEDRERIFGIFERLHGRSAYPGSGIGLAVCRKVVEHHGGRIWVESSSGEGSVFFFTIPALLGDAERAGTALEQESQSPGMGCRADPA